MKREPGAINVDEPLRGASALVDDALEREGFARSVREALGRVSSVSGFVVSIEGAWGSGKTSTLAILQHLIEREAKGEWLMVGFNPWLVGDRESLLREFLGSIAEAIELADTAQDAKNAAGALKRYSKAFDLLKWVPGAEPWASIVKGVVHSAGDALDGAAEQRALSLSQQKQQLEEALKHYGRRILVLIDDVDRLFPAEVFEMIRIVKAVGGLANVGYVLAWDHKYVAKALEVAAVPYPAAYLDKIVQVRLSLPPMPSSARMKLVDAAIKTLPWDARRHWFSGQDMRLKSLYGSGLYEMLEQPRDVSRVFGAVSAIEPGLRGEVVLADIIGLACLMVRAPAVYELLKTRPWAFVPGYVRMLPHPVESMSADERKQCVLAALDAAPAGAAKIVAHLFPELGLLSSHSAVPHASTGCICAPMRLDIALQLSVAGDHVGSARARAFLSQPSRRPGILEGLSRDNALAFFEALERALDDPDFELAMAADACLQIARDADAYGLRTAPGDTRYSLGPADLAIRAIARIVATARVDGAGIAAQIVGDERSLSCAAQVLKFALPDNRQLGLPTDALEPPGDAAIESYARNVLKDLQQGTLWHRAEPALILWMLGMWDGGEAARQAFEFVARKDASLDRFAAAFFLFGDSAAVHDPVYAFPPDAIVRPFASREAFEALARRRLDDATLEYPARAAWQCVFAPGCVDGATGRPLE